MPIQAPPWTEFLSCPICCHKFDRDQRGPISLGCGHTVCQACLAKLQSNQCPYDQTIMRLPLDQLPVNDALLSLVKPTALNDSVGKGREEEDLGASQNLPLAVLPNHASHYLTATQCIKELALLLKPYEVSGLNGLMPCVLSRPMQRKLVSLINCQLVEEEGRARAVRAARSLGERSVTELILRHQDNYQLSANLWAAVRSRGSHFLGPAMQEEVLKLVLLALEDGSALSRKVLVMFVVQRLEPHFPSASKTSIGHVVQLLYRASCFKLSQRDSDSSLMQLKEEFRTYESLRREHDTQIVQIANEAGLRITPDQWSSLLYGDTAHKSHMQSIMDRLQTPQSFGQSVQELVMALQRTSDVCGLNGLRGSLSLLASLDPSPDADPPSWESCAEAVEAAHSVVAGLVCFSLHHAARRSNGGGRHAEGHPNSKYNSRYKVMMCQNLKQRGGCPRGNECTYAHSNEELDCFRSRVWRESQSFTSNSSQCHNGSSFGASQTRSSKVLMCRDLMQRNSCPRGHDCSFAHSKAEAEPPQRSRGTHQSAQNGPTTSSTSNNYSDYYMYGPQNQYSKLPNQTHQTHTAIHAPPPPVGRSLTRAMPPPPQIQAPPPPAAPVAVQTPLQPPPTLVIKNGDRASMLPFEMMAPPPITPFAAPPPLPLRPSVLSNAPTPIYATQLPPDFAYNGAYHTQTPIFAPPTAPTVPQIAMHPAPPAAAAPTAPVYSPSVMHEMFPVLNPAGTPFFNVVGGVAIADTCPTNTLISSWAENAPAASYVGSTRAFNPANEASAESSFPLSVESNNVQAIASKTLPQLQKRKEELLNRLHTLVSNPLSGSVMVNGTLTNADAASTSVSSRTFSPTYSIWTSGANLATWSDIGRTVEARSWNDNDYRPSETNQKEFIPFEPPVVSRFGPISRTDLRNDDGCNAIQVSAHNTSNALTTPTVHRPVPTISPMPQVLCPPGIGVATWVPCAPAPALHTIGHGIIDPPHLHMSQLDPRGGRPTDPVVDASRLGAEERSRRHFIAATDGIDTQRFEALQLKEELSLVMHGIQQKTRQMELHLGEGGETGHGRISSEGMLHQFSQNAQDEDMADFEKNWKFDFDEGEKDD